MKVPDQPYTLAGFLGYIRDHHDLVFEEDERKKWLKVYTVLHNFSDWQAELFSEAELRKMGDLSEIQLTRDSEIAEGGRDERYYAIEFRKGLLLFFTSAIQEGFEATLGTRIRKTRGVTQAWISPPLFQRVWQSVLERHGGYVYRFTSRRAPLDDTPARLRPAYKRRFSYTGDDGTQVVKELQAEYGVTPESMYLRISPDLVVQLTNLGLFSAREISPLALEIFFGILTMTMDELISTKTTSERLSFDVANMLGEASLPLVASIVAGKIALGTKPLTADLVDDFVSNAEDFSFLDTRVKEGSLGYSATVVDEVKGSVFDVSVTESEISLIPKYNWTFESFIGFLKAVREQLDERATLSLWGGPEG